MRALTRDFLEWIEKEPRPYREVMEAWRTHCPRHMIWEDAVDDGLVAFAGGLVALSDKGRAELHRQDV
jgi:hypothetical protein